MNATIIAALTSTKNKGKAHSPEMRQAKKATTAIPCGVKNIDIPAIFDSSISTLKIYDVTKQ
ncbi:MAG: hypothetical protein LBI87_10875 [Candidatus Accumulibacter sp.]|nr:hypothetical protein [Accumulibacter sp.]